MASWRKVAIVGVGLIGGSIGQGLLRRSLAAEVVGIGRRAGSLRTAKRVGAVTAVTTDLAKGLAQAELVVVCTPVDAIVETVRLAATLLDGDGLITDVGSTKEGIVRELDKAARTDPAWPRDVRFLGSHPLAGNERSGAQHSSADLLNDRVVIVTPGRASRPADVATLTGFWRSLGARVAQLSPRAHDRALAATSHLPHLVASALAGTTPLEALQFVAGGWLDTTRIAAGDPALWRQIFLANREHLLAAAKRFEKRTAVLRTAIARGDFAKIEKLLLEAKQVRDAVGS